jgi:hypothetical protein
MSADVWYLQKADQCLSLAKASTDARQRARYEEDAVHWRQIAADIGKNERDRFGSDGM